MLEQARAETVAAASREASERAQRDAAIEARVTADANRRLELELARRVRGSMSAISWSPFCSHIRDIYQFEDRIICARASFLQCCRHCKTCTTEIYLQT